MEFACGFVYVPPSVNLKNETVFKRSGRIFFSLSTHRAITLKEEKKSFSKTTLMH